MKNYMNTIFPIIGKIPELFGVDSKETFRKDLGEVITSGTKEFELKESEKIDENSTVMNLIPGAREIPLQKLFDAGFTIKAYLKEDSEFCVDDLQGSGVIILNIQHEDPNKALLVDGYSMQFDPITEIQIATLNTLILDNEKPGLFGKKYDISEAVKVGSMKIRDILLEREEAKRIRDERLQKYRENPELQNRDTKKLLENLKHKYNTLKNKEDANLSQEFTKGALQILGSIAGINDLKSFDDIKNIPIFKAELDKNTSFSGLLNKFCEMAKQLPTNAN